LYARQVTVSAADVAAELRRRLPGLGVKKQHKLLYYCQGHHLAAFGEPLFAESLSAWDMGPVVGQLWHQERNGTASPTGASLTEAQLNTIGYVISRYGGLTGADLERLTHAEPPWQEADKARPPKDTVKIPLESLQAYFGSPAAGDDDDDDAVPESDAITRWLGQVGGPPQGPSSRDTVESLRARLTSA
jgi:uncharacterized phage-associated protein